MKWSLICLISFYQTYISPHKGFCCAHRRLHGGKSCSQAIKNIVLSRGLLGGLSDIKSRFNECNAAAVALRQKSYPPLRTDLDCGLGGCAGCADIGGADACLFGGGDASSPTITRPIIFFPAGIFTLLIILACVYWFVGRQVDFIEIRLLDASQETSDKHLAKLFNEQLPDYQLIVDAKGRKIKTDTLKNSSAVDWLQLIPKGAVYRSDINRLIVINKQILKDQVLDTFENPAGEGTGKFYEYRVHNKWQIF